jgi:uncharacterized protein (TIGR02145 family)
MVTWTCEWINDPRSQKCKWCPTGYKYNRYKGYDFCEKTCCEYEPWITYVEPTSTTSWYYIANSCHTSITLMDTNLWAKTPWTGSGSVGYYFQWWNNHWFTLNDKGDGLKSTDMIRERARREEKWNKHWYDWEKFIVAKENEEECIYYNYWEHPGYDKKGNCVGWTVHRDIRWWGIDWYVAWCYANQFWTDTMLKVHSNDITDYIHDRKVARHCYMDVTEFMLNTWALSRQWPCPKWWHVPSAWEWGQLLRTYCEVNPMKCKNDNLGDKYESSLSNWILPRSITNDNLGNSFMDAFKLPKSWRILADYHYPGKLVSKWDEGFYWSSSYSSDEYVSYLWFNKSQIYATRTNGESKRWAPIRCFKNPEIIDDSKFSCDDKYSLHIQYATTGWMKLYGDYTASYNVWSGYNIKSPAIEGYYITTSTGNVVSWTMKNKDIDIIVEYDKKS